MRTDRREQAGLIVHFKVNKIFNSFVPLNQLDNDVTISLMAIPGGQDTCQKTWIADAGI